jgi:hypothetical protein
MRQTFFTPPPSLKFCVNNLTKKTNKTKLALSKTDLPYFVEWTMDKKIQGGEGEIIVRIVYYE